MALKKTTFGPDEIEIFNEALIYKRGKYWQFRLWLAKENKYARKSLLTSNQTTAVDKAKDFYLEILSNQKSGKKYFSLTTKQGVEMYVKHREKDCDNELIVKGRLGTIKTHLAHWLDFIKKDAKLKELARTDCEDYFQTRKKTNKKISVPDFVRSKVVFVIVLCLLSKIQNFMRLKLILPHHTFYWFVYLPTVFSIFLLIVFYFNLSVNREIN